MELFTLCLAIAYMVTGKFNKDTAIAAYQHGQEPPGLAKARMRHERRGGHYNESGRPVGPGSTRLLLSTWWSAACQKAADRQHDKLRRWRAWYAEQAPQRDEQWRAKQRAKLQRRQRRLQRFEHARGLISSIPERVRERQAWAENERRDRDREQAIEQVHRDAQQLRDHEQRSTDEQTTGPSLEDIVQDAFGRLERGEYKLMSRDVWDDLPPDAKARIRAKAAERGATLNDLWTGGYLRASWPEEPVSVLDNGLYVPLQSSADEEPDPAVDTATEANDSNDTEPKSESETAESSAEEPESASATTQQSARSDTAAAETSSSQASGTNATTDTEGVNVYQQAAQKLTKEADEIEQYNRAFQELADAMEAVGWGAEAHGPLADLRTTFEQVTAHYRELAEQMRHQGDQVNDAYDQAPWAPDRRVLVGA